MPHLTLPGPLRMKMSKLRSKSTSSEHGYNLWKSALSTEAPGNPRTPLDWLASDMVSHSGKRRNEDKIIRQHFRKVDTSKSIHKTRKNQKLDLNFIKSKHLYSTKEALTSNVEGQLGQTDGQGRAITTQLLVNSTSVEKQLCINKTQCGLWADCVAINKNGPKQCWCVGELSSPDPQTGHCQPRTTGHVPDHKSHGVLLEHHIKDIFSHSSHNGTYAQMSNKSSSMFRISTEGSSYIFWPQLVSLVLGSLVLIFVIVVVSFIYRRRYLIKRFCSNRSGDRIVRNSDGVMLLDRMNTVSNNPTYLCVNIRRQDIPQVATEHLKLLEVVGEGAFGQVFKGDLYTPESKCYKQVAVKVLKEGATHEVQEDFEREVEVTATFDHDNILKLLGVVPQGPHGGPFMVFEYMEYGDLSELLRRNDPHFRCQKEKYITLSKADLVDVSVQIANGMSYLTEQRFVHRDLATRNCLVGSGLVVKISDFGMSRDVYTNDYYRVGGARMLPVRWMSPEALKYGRFTCESDIWAYGVVLWEIFSYGKQPYFGHTHEEVMHFLEQGILLQRPDDCPSTVYHVMIGCWKRDPKQRISFQRLAKYLTDFRSRLSKPPGQQQQPQQQQDLYFDHTKRLQCLDGDVAVQDNCVIVEESINGASIHCPDKNGRENKVYYLPSASSNFMPDEAPACSYTCLLQADLDLLTSACTVNEATSTNK